MGRFDARICVPCVASGVAAAAAGFLFVTVIPETLRSYRTVGKDVRSGNDPDRGRIYLMLDSGPLLNLDYGPCMPLLYHSSALYKHFLS